MVARHRRRAKLFDLLSSVSLFIERRKVVVRTRGTFSSLQVMRVNIAPNDSQNEFRRRQRGGDVGLMVTGRLSIPVKASAEAAR